MEARRTYEPWDSPRLVLDSGRAMDESVREAILYIEAHVPIR